MPSSGKITRIELLSVTEFVSARWPSFFYNFKIFKLKKLLITKDSTVNVFLFVFAEFIDPFASKCSFKTFYNPLTPLLAIITPCDEPWPFFHF